MSAPRLGVVLLAAGQGTRMKSSLHKVLHPVCGKAMASHILDAARELSPDRIVVVVGHHAEQVRAALGAPEITFVDQTELLGTGDAVARCKAALEGCERVLVLNGDEPLLTSATLARLIDAGRGTPMAFVSQRVADAGALGRVRRDGALRVMSIVQAADDPDSDGKAEINWGEYLFEGSWLWEQLPRVPLSPKGERYLTKLADFAFESGTPAVTIAADPVEALGVDDRVKLAEAERRMRERILQRHMLAGVTISDPQTTYIDATVGLATDVTVLPGCHLTGTTVVETGSVIGPGTTLRNAMIGRESGVRQSVIEDSRIGSDVSVGPFAHVRGGATIGDGCELGNYAEVKNSVLGAGVKMHHFSYIGDADVGDYTNVGAGSITCNYDGVQKHRTTIGKRVFIGSDSMLIAPVTLGDGASTGAGSVVTKDVAAGDKVVGVPARAFSPKKPPEG